MSSAFDDFRRANTNRLPFQIVSSIDRKPNTTSFHHATRDSQLERELDNLMLKSYQEQDIYATTFNSMLENEANNGAITSPTKTSSNQALLQEGVENLMMKIQTFIEKLKSFKRDFVAPLANIRFNQPQQHAFLLTTVPKDVGHLLDLESLLLVELNNFDPQSSLLSGALRHWSIRTKHYGTAFQHVLVVREILRAEAMENPQLRNLMEGPKVKYCSPWSVLDEIERRLEFYEHELQVLVSFMPQDHPEQVQVKQFAHTLGQLLDGYLINGINSHSDNRSERSSVQFCSSPSLSNYTANEGGLSFSPIASPPLVMPGEKAVDLVRVSTLNNGISVSKRIDPLNELLATEESYLEDLRIIDEVFVAKIRTIDPSKSTTDLIINNLFYNYRALMHESRLLIEGLRQRQPKDPMRTMGSTNSSFGALTTLMLANDLSSLGNGASYYIGDLMVQFATRAMSAYGDYGSHATFSMRFYASEKLGNSKLALCLREAEMDPRVNRKAINTFLARPTYRLGQYPLLLRQILKHTPRDTPESTHLLDALMKIESCLAVLDELTDREERRLQLRTLQDRMFYKSGDISRFGLTDDHHEILHEGNLIRPPFGIRLKIFLFDHAILLTKPRRVKLAEDLEEYDLIKKPIPLDELYLEATNSKLLRWTQSKSQLATTFTIVRVTKDRMDRIALAASCLAEREVWMDKINAQRERVLASKAMSQLSFATL